MSKIKKWALAFMLLPFLSGCVSTQVKSVHPSGWAKIRSTDKVLIPEIKGVSTYQSYLLYQDLEAQLQKAGIQPSYSVSEELFLAQYKVPLIPDTSHFGVLKKEFGYDYLLLPEIILTKKGLAYAHRSEEELRQNGRTSSMNEETAHKATIRLRLYEIASRESVYDFMVTTEISAISVPEKDGDEHEVNLGSSERAVQKALRKGLKKMLE